MLNVKDIKELIGSEYRLWRSGSEKSCPKKVIDTIAAASDFKIDLSEFRFVDMDSQEDRDYDLDIAPSKASEAYRDFRLETQRRVEKLWTRLSVL